MNWHCCLNIELFRKSVSWPALVIAAQKNIKPNKKCCLIQLLSLTWLLDDCECIISSNVMNQFRCRQIVSHLRTYTFIGRSKTHTAGTNIWNKRIRSEVNILTFRMLQHTSSEVCASCSLQNWEGLERATYCKGPLHGAGLRRARPATH